MYLRNDILGKLMMIPEDSHRLMIKQKDHVPKVKKSAQDRNPRIKDLWSKMGSWQKSHKQGRSASYTHSSSRQLSRTHHMPNIDWTF